MIDTVDMTSFCGSASTVPIKLFFKEQQKIPKKQPILASSSSNPILSDPFMNTKVYLSSASSRLPLEKSHLSASGLKQTVKAYQVIAGTFAVKKNAQKRPKRSSKLWF